MREQERWRTSSFGGLEYWTRMTLPRALGLLVLVVMRVLWVWSRRRAEAVERQEDKLRQHRNRQKSKEWMPAAQERLWGDHHSDKS